MKKFTDQFFREIPKTDLHVHLDGSLRPETVKELAAEIGGMDELLNDNGLESVFK